MIPYLRSLGVFVVPTTAGTITGKRLALSPGANEVAAVHAMYWCFSAQTPTGGGLVVDMGIWRQSQTLPPALLGAREHGYAMAWMTDWRVIALAATQEQNLTDHGYLVFPKPLIFIRTPQLVTSFSGCSSVHYHMTIYYEMLKATDREIQNLMALDPS